MSRSVPATLQELMETRGISLTERVDRVAAYTYTYLQTCDHTDPYPTINSNGATHIIPDLNLLEQCSEDFYTQCLSAFADYDLSVEKAASTEEYVAGYKSAQQYVKQHNNTGCSSDGDQEVKRLCDLILADRDDFIAAFGETIVTPITGLTVNAYNYPSLKQSLVLEGWHFSKLETMLEERGYTFFATSTESYYLHPLSHPPVIQDFEDLIDKELYAAASQGCNVIACDLKPNNRRALMLNAYALEAGDQHSCHHSRQELANYAQKMNYNLDYKIYHWAQYKGPSLSYMTNRGIRIECLTAGEGIYAVEITFSVTDTTTPAGRELTQLYNDYYKNLTTHYRQAIKAIDYAVQHPDQAITENDSPLLFSARLDLPVTATTTENLKLLIENTPYSVIVYDTHYRIYHRDSVSHKRNLKWLARYYHNKVQQKLWHSLDNLAISYTYGTPRDEAKIFEAHQHAILEALTPYNDQQHVTQDDVDNLRQAISEQWNPHVPFLTVRAYIGQHHLADDITAELLNNSLYTPLLRDYFVIDVYHQKRSAGWAEITLAAKPTTPEDVVGYVTDIFNYVTQRCRYGFDFAGLEPEELTWEGYCHLQPTFALALKLYLRQQTIIDLTDEDITTISEYKVPPDITTQLSDVLITLDNTDLAHVINDILSEWFDIRKDIFAHKAQMQKYVTTLHNDAHTAFFERVYRCLESNWCDTLETMYYSHTRVRIPKDQYYKSFFEECVDKSVVLNSTMTPLYNSQHIAKSGYHYDELTGAKYCAIDFYAI